MASLQVHFFPLILSIKCYHHHCQHRHRHPRHRDPLNGAWCDNLYFPDVEELEELTPCGEDNNFYSSAGEKCFSASKSTFVESSLHLWQGMGMGLVSEAAAVELGIQTREDGEARVRVSRSEGSPMFSWQVRQSLETVLSSWPRETTHGFLQHFTTRFSFIHSGLTAYRQDFTPPYSRQMNVVSEYSTIDSTILVGLTQNPNSKF